jgi:hypothetical protein
MTTTRGRFVARAAGLALFCALSLGAAAAQAVIVRTAVNYRPHPVARTAVTTAAVVGTAAIVGSAVRSIPPSCTTVMVGAVAYNQCGNTWYQPRYSGSQVTYVVVNPPAR